MKCLAPTESRTQEVSAAVLFDYVLDREILNHRGRVRFRQLLQNQLAGYKVRITHLLYSNGVPIFVKHGTHWLRRFMRWFREDIHLLSSTWETLDLLLDQMEHLRTDVLALTRKIHQLSRTELYANRMDLLLSVLSIGRINAISLFTELENPDRHHGQKSFASYLGIFSKCFYFL